MAIINNNSYRLAKAFDSKIGNAKTAKTEAVEQQTKTATVNEIISSFRSGKTSYADALKQLESQGVKITQSNGTAMFSVNGKAYTLTNPKTGSTNKTEETSDDMQKARNKDIQNIPENHVTSVTGKHQSRTYSVTNGDKIQHHPTEEEAIANMEGDLACACGFYEDLANGSLDGNASMGDMDGTQINSHSTPFVGVEDKEQCIADGGKYREINITNIRYSIESYEVHQDKDGWYVTGTIKVDVTYDMTTTTQWKKGDQYMDDSGNRFERTDNGWKDMAAGRKPGAIVNYQGNMYVLGKDGKWIEMPKQQLDATPAKVSGKPIEDTTRRDLQGSDTIY